MGGEIIQEAVGTFSQSESDLLNALESLVKVYKKEKVAPSSIMIPLSVFKKNKLGILEVLVKVLKENYQLSFRSIAKMIERDERTVWTAYHMSKHKEIASIVLSKDAFYVPLSIFNNRKIGPLESLIIYMRIYYSLSFKEIAKILNRDYKTVWLSFKNGTAKGGVNEVTQLN